MSGPFWRVGGLRTLAAKVLDLYSRTRHLFWIVPYIGVFSRRSGVTFGYTVFFLSLSDWERGWIKKKKGDGLVGWFGWFGLG